RIEVAVHPAVDEDEQRQLRAAGGALARDEGVRGDDDGVAGALGGWVWVVPRRRAGVADLVHLGEVLDAVKEGRLVDALGEHLVREAIVGLARELRRLRLQLRAGNPGDENKNDRPQN